MPARVVEVYTDPDESGQRRCERYDESAILPCPIQGVGELPLTALFAR